jgi:hypothetical protein
MSNKVDLVTDRYYDKGIRYQEHINRIQRTADRQDQILVRQDSESVTLEFPCRDLTSRIDGTITMYRPSDRQHDFTLGVKPDTNGLQRITTDTFKRGFWRIQITWREDNEEYFSESPIMIH